MHARLSRAQIERALRAHRARRYPIPGLRRAAVLIALFHAEPQDQTRLWLLRRPDDGTPHGGQVALPGGKREPGEELGATALREASEEIGLAPEQVELIGVLDELITITRFRVTPYVGWIRGAFEPIPNPREADRVFAVPLEAFAAEPEQHRVSLAGFSPRVDSTRIAGELVWGATFRILRGLVSMVR